MATAGEDAHGSPEIMLLCSSLTFQTLIETLMDSGSSSTETSQPSEPAAEVGHSTPSTGKSWCVASHSSTKPVERSSAAIIALVCFLFGSLSGLNTEMMLPTVPRTDLPGSAIARASLRLNRRSSATFQNG